MNVDRRWWGASVVRVRILAAGLLLLGVGCAFLGWGSRSRQKSAKVTAAAMNAGQLGMGSTPLAVPGTAGEAIAGQTRSIFSGLPLIFEPNQGQGNLKAADPRAKFVTHGSGYSLVLGSQGATLSLVSHEAKAKHAASGSDLRVDVLEMKLAGANPKAGLTATDPLPGKTNYFIGNDPAKWRTGVAQFARVRYEDIYPGINLVFYGNQGRLEYDFQVAPGSDPAQAELEFNGAKRLELKDGALVIHSDGESVRLEAPRVYQEIAGKQQSVEGRFVLRGPRRAGFSIGAYDRSRELIIDPILNFSTYFGGTGDEHSTSVAVDGSFNIYLTGSTTSLDLPTTPGAFQPAIHGAQNVYIAKITPPLGSLVAVLDNLTYLGGGGTDAPVGIKVDGEGNPFVAGTTSSSDFPTTPTNAYQTVAEAGSVGTSHVFVTKLKFDFTQLNYSSYLSGNGTDVASGMTIDPAGNLYVTGTTTSSDTASTTVQFPASTLPEGLPFQSFPRAPIQFFVTKVNTNAPGTASIPYSTYFGGGTFETPTPIAVGGGITVDTNQNVYFTGTTNFTYTGCSGCSTTDFPILNAYQPCLDTPPTAVVINPPPCTTSTTTTASDAFVAKLNPSAPQGQQLIWSTYLGGSQTDSSTGVALDAGAANVYVVGTTNSQQFVQIATSSFAGYQKCLNNLPQTTATLVTCAPQTDPAPSDAFVARLTNPSTTATTTPVTLNYFSYLGGANNEAGTAITVDSNSGAMITGWTQSPNTGADGTFPVFPNPNSIQSNLKGTQDAFVARLNTGAVIGQTTVASWASYFGGSGTDSGTGIALDVNQNTYLVGDTNSTDLQVAKPLQANLAGTNTFDAFATQLGTAVSLSISGLLNLGTDQTYVSAGNPAQFTYTVTNNGPDPANNIVITGNLSSAVTGVALSAISGSISTGTCTTGGSTSTSLSCGPISLQSGSTATVTITATPAADSNGASPEFFNGGTVQAIAPGNIVLAQTSVPAQMSDFSMSVSPSNQSIPVAGATATYEVQLTPHPLYGSSINLSCAGLPSATTCNFTSSSVKLTSVSGATSTLNIVTTPRPLTPVASIFVRRFYAVWLVIPGLALLGIGGDRRRRRIAGILMLCTIFSMLLLLPACSHSTQQTPSSGTQAGNYTITVTASSGSDSKSQTIGLTVP
ncbi:MAG TPA: SBBP repeat-containing protein [Candidatus Dormibacteraeota bacterium]|nr:SBBP repeat-containing protein [Candidatus Dormibacteraeota bacterium]